MRLPFADQTAFASRRDTLGLLAAVPFLSAQSTPSPAPGDIRLMQNLMTRMGVQVRLNDGPPEVFVIDTGAERSAVSVELAQALALPPGRPVVVHGVTAAETTPTVTVARIEIGHRRFSDLNLPVFPRDALSADGLLGLDLLSRFRLTLDMLSRRAALALSGSPGLALTRDTEIGSVRQQEVVVAGRRGRSAQLILTHVEVNGIPTAAFIDSGAQYSIGNLALMRAADIRPAVDPARPVRMVGIVGGAVEVRTGAAQTLRLAERSLGPTPLLFADLHLFQIMELIDQPALLLGADVLSRFSRITLDYGRSRVAFGGLLRRAPGVRSP
ncbi:aspartyl protease family protein [Brevundimonas vesicularis]|uniref:aspartyl protease family protein n=1 Tax=Brevundimonas vesicularis TaxID=41276 RepID=UPI0022EC4AD1|nr:aspartyl protease family protein [Brevundimonas vesicularis]WBT06774.1 aspartyl protease family protein [Brevundimonas vesicularis]